MIDSSVTKAHAYYLDKDVPAGKAYIDWQALVKSCPLTFINLPQVLYHGTRDGTCAHPISRRASRAVVSSANDEIPN
jgi:hypothetical protein